MPHDPPATGFDNPSCCARGNGTCNSTISGEHYISEAMLKVLGPEVKISGLVVPEKSLRTEVLKANILCTSHNSVLSPLDAVAKRLFENLREHLLSMTKALPTSQLFLLNGNDVEYTLLKMMTGLVASGAVARLARQDVPEAWVKILFGRQAWPDERGLYVEQVIPGIQDGNVDGYGVGMNVDSNGVPYEIGVRFAAWHFVLHLGDGSRKQDARFRFRPTLLVTQMGAVKNGVSLTYSDPSADGFVRATVHSFTLPQIAPPITPPPSSSVDPDPSR